MDYSHRQVFPPASLSMVESGACTRPSTWAIGLAPRPFFSDFPLAFAGVARIHVTLFSGGVAVRLDGEVAMAEPRSTEVRQAVGSSGISVRIGAVGDSAGQSLVPSL